ncbi:MULTISPECIES: hypothetical protein [unclassified Moraxella]|uniref:hypothetical protein n=1 Tax=unclassified Moraxella TaxID=2685852 RepID=UPI003AF4B85F
MNYVGFLCLGLGILSLVGGMICLLLALVSHEKAIQIKAKRFACLFLPLAFLLLMVGGGMTFSILFPNE